MDGGRNAVQISLGGRERRRAHTGWHLAKPRWLGLLVREATRRPEVDFDEVTARRIARGDEVEHSCIDATGMRKASDLVSGVGTKSMTMSENKSGSRSAVEARLNPELREIFKQLVDDYNDAARTH